MTSKMDTTQTTWPDGFVEANGLRMHYWRTSDSPLTGDGSKPALVLCHGYSDNGLCWTPVVRRLEDDFDVLMVDARGHGLSDAPEGGYTTSDRADDVAAFVQALGLEKPAILGHSMGASTAAAAAAACPDLFSKVLLEDPAWRDDESPRRMRRGTTPEERAAWLEERRAQIVKQNQMSIEELIALCREQSPSWQEDELAPWALSKQQLSPNVAGGWEAKPKPWTAIAPAIVVPTLLITADTEKGGIVTKEIAEAAQALNDQIEVVHLPEAGHNIRREAFEAYVEAVRAFLMRA
jgi:N-formylmaleamate deformylase